MSDQKQPQWNAFEKVHISLKPAEILAGQRESQTPADSSHPQVTLPATGQPTLKADNSATQVTDSANDVRLQIRELTKANLDLRSQLERVNTNGHFHEILRTWKSPTLSIAKSSRVCRRHAAT